MTSKELKSRIKFCEVKIKKITTASPTITSRRDPNFVDMTDLESSSIEQDFFEFEEELSKMKPSNKTTSKGDK